MSQDFTPYPAQDHWLSRPCPVPCSPIGYGFLIQHYGLKVPVPLRLFGIGTKQRPRQDWDFDDYTGWTVLEPRYWPKNGLRGQLTFALKYEGVDLAVLKRLFTDVPDVVPVIERWFDEMPNSRYAKSLITFGLFFDQDDVFDVEKTTSDSNYINVIDVKLQLSFQDFDETPVPEIDSELWVNGNARAFSDVLVPAKTTFPNVESRNFLPLVRRTAAIDAYLARDWVAEIGEMTAKHKPEHIQRAAAYMLSGDSRASFEIENEKPSADRNQAWAEAIGQTMRGRDQDLLSKEKLLELQNIILGGQRFQQLGFRNEGGFIGSHDRDTGMPKPVFISARHQDLDSLLDGLIHFARVGIYATHPIVAAAILSFGFVNIHPFADGNGRIHRYLIHYVLSKRGMHVDGLIFPVSIAIKRNLQEYIKVLQSYQARALPHIDWQPTDRGNVEVLNQTADLYRYWDATPHVEFLFKMVDQTLRIDLPRELAALKLFDDFEKAVDQEFALPGWRVSLAFNVLSQNGGKMSKAKRTKQFDDLADDHIQRLEEILAEVTASADAVQR